MALRRTALLAALLVWPGLARAADSDEGSDTCGASFSAAPELTKAGHLLDARAALIRCASDACPSKMRPLCADDLRNLEAQIPTVVFAAKTSTGEDVLDARVLEGGHPVAERLGGTAIAIDPGPHRFRFERPDGSSEEVQVLLREGEKAREVLSVFSAKHPVDESAASPGTSSRPIPWTVWASGGVALAATGSFAFFGIRGLNQRASLDYCKGSCTSAQVQPVRDSYVAADVSLAVAAVAVGLAVTLYLTRPKVTLDLAGTAAFVHGEF